MATPPLHPKDPNASPCDKISSNCIIWQGRDIPCIDLCTGDTIDEVVNKLAVILCEIADLVNLDVSCLLASGEVAPKTITEFAELIIESICDLKGTTVTFRNQINLLIASIPNPDNPLDPIYPLPPGLYFYDSKGDIVTQLPLSDYVYYLASKIVDIIAFNDYYKQQQEIINTKFDNLALRVSTLETTAAVPPDIFVISQGASHYIPGTVLPIAEGFWNFERNYVNFSGTVGNTTDLTTAITRQTPNLANLPQLSNPALFMKNIAGWINSPLTLADSFGNLWLTMTDLRARVQAIINATPTVPCITVPIENLKVTAITSYYATIEFTPSSLTTIQAPIGYLVEVFDPLDTDFIRPVFSSTVNSSPVTISSTGLGVNQEYVISVTALYSCGNSVRMTTNSILLIPIILFQIKMLWTETGTSTGLSCHGLDGVTTVYDQKISTLQVYLVNKITGDRVTNTGTTDIAVVVKVKHTICGNDSFEDVTILIEPGTTEREASIVSYALIPCVDGSCGIATAVPECGISISNPSTEFDGTTILPCITS